ncbi:2671_t:CDS:2 [Entrophospora sp. SA101]|nr:2671_t:CDS:2 [Entrophospora sp. SA101]
MVQLFNLYVYLSDIDLSSCNLKNDARTNTLIVGLKKNIDVSKYIQ